MGEKDEFVPDGELLEVIIAEVIQPVLEDLREELGQPVPCVLHVLSGSMSGPSVLLTSAAQPDAEDGHSGEVRLRCRRTFRDSRFVFFAESIFRDIAVDTGFSGFEIKGQVLLSADGITAKRDSLTMRYNVWNWSGWV